MKGPVSKPRHHEVKTKSRQKYTFTVRSKHPAVCLFTSTYCINTAGYESTTLPKDYGGIRLVMANYTSKKGELGELTKTGRLF